MTFDELKRNIRYVTEAVRAQAARAGSTVRVIAATKTVPPDIIQAAVDSGLTELGENRVQEYVQKRDVVTGCNWHFIGSLQRNKVKYLVGNVALIQSVSSAELGEEISRVARKRGVIQDVLIELNADDETAKTGAPFDTADALIQNIRALAGVRLRGIMSVPKIAAPDDTYKKLFDLFLKYKDEEFDTLSVGMSGDYEKAIRFGSNMVRIGAGFFGKRNQV